MELSEHQLWVKTTLGEGYPYVNQGLDKAVRELIKECAEAPDNERLMLLAQEVEKELVKQRLIMAVLYCGLGLAGEAGEVANKAKKVLRDDGGELTPERVLGLMKELGGTLWYWMQVCTELGLDSGQVAAANRHEIESRIRRGTLKGDGDDR